ncbi:uncharacterized protein LOC143265010 [Megachile rotundata]|uniref:uncharacterized protein LOC143265010 n=1 Tax=Megachile rotundata TaxID=143995 RepID=UPI003FD68F03
MDEDSKKHNDILHIFPASNDPTNAVIHYLPRNVQISGKSRFNLKFNIKKIIKACKKRYSGVSRKYPRVTREHTDFEKHPYKMTCPNCLCYIITDTYHHNSTVTHVIAASLFPSCLCMIPYLTTKFKDTSHYCPICKIFLGRKYASGGEMSILLD